MSNTRAARIARTAASAPHLRLNSPPDVLAIVPYLLGFHPRDSIVVLGIGGPRMRVRVTSRADLPQARGESAAAEARRVAEVLSGASADEAVVVAYGTEERARPAIDHTRVALGERRVGVRDALRAHDGRYWSDECSEPACCPPEGTPYDIATSRVAAAATVAGLVALPDRESLERSVSPVGAVAPVSVRQATARAEQRVQAWAAESSGPAAGCRRVLDEGRARVRAALDRFRGGGDLCDDDTAVLGVLLASLQVRDETWLLIGEAGMPAHLALWTHLTRRVEQRYVPAPASLLAFAAWQDGNGALASVATDRALQADPGYSMAHLVRETLDMGLPPSAWEPPMTADELAASHDRAARDGDLQQGVLLPGAPRC